MVADKNWRNTNGNEKYQQLDDWIAGIVRIFVLLVWIGHPLLLLPNTYYSIVDAKRVYFSVCLLALCFVLFFLALVANMIAPGFVRWPGIKKALHHVRAYEYMAIAYWVILVISTIVSDDPMAALMGSNVNNEGLLMQTAYLLTAVLIGRFYRLQEGDLLAFCTVATVVAGIGILQYYGWDFLHLSPQELGHPVGRQLVYISTMSNRNILSTYLCLAFCVCLVLFSRYQPGKKGRLACLPMAWIIFYMLILGDSESGYVGIVMAVALLFPFIIRTWKSAGRFLFLCSGCLFLLWVIERSFAALGWDFFFQGLTPIFLPLAFTTLVLAILGTFAPLPAIAKRVYRIGWYLCLVLVIILFLLTLPVLQEKTQNSTLQQAAEIMQGNIQDEFATNRVFVWRRALELVAERPVIGYGPDQFYPQFQKRFGAEALEKHGVEYNKAHNEYLQFLVDGGVLSLFCILGFYAAILRPLCKGKKDTCIQAVFLAMVAFLIQAFFNFSTPLAHPIVWTLWGVLGSAQTRRALPGSAGLRPDPQTF